MATSNQISFRPFSFSKKFILPPGAKVRTVQAGIFKGIKLEIDFATQTQLYLGMYETEIFSFCRAAVARSKWMIDVGAGAGELALYFMKEHGPKTVVAFEPLDVSRNAFVRNLANNGWSNDSIKIYSDFAGLDRKAVALDSLDVDRSAPGFIKIDVDGAEMDVLRSAAELIKLRTSDLLVEVHSKSLEEQCLNFLKEAGYRTTIVDNAWWRLFIPERRIIEHNRWVVARPV